MIRYRQRMLLKQQNGFTLIELMIVVAIISVLAMVAYPSYQNYVVKSKRTDMMSEMQNIGSQIEAKKLAAGSYANVSTTGLTGSYPRSGTALYNITVTPSPLTHAWTVTATPVAGQQMAGDGILSLEASGKKCRKVDNVSTCGTGDEWN